jgi:predicted GNAT superfamily acetyltransferase
MLAVLPQVRNSGIGRRLKLYQRQEALSRSISLMEWTFDPLEIKNAFLNIHRLGVIVRSYTPNFYGVSSSRLQAGLPTDRLHAEWWMDSERVRAILSGSPYTPPEILETITVPHAVAEWKASSVSRAEAVQSEIRERFLSAFARGLAVIGFRVDSEGNGIFELAHPQPEGSENL